MRIMPSRMPLPQWIPPQFSQLVKAAPFGPEWLHENKLDGFRMAARIEKGAVRLLTRTGLDWSTQYPAAVEALSKVKAKAAYLDGELCGIGEDGLPSFAHTQAATDNASGAHLVYFAFDLLHLDGRDTARLPLLERKALLEPLVAELPGLQFNGHETGDGELVRRHACKIGFEGVVFDDCEERFDLVVAFAVIHEMPSAASFFAEAARAMKPGASLLLVEPSGHITKEEFDSELAHAARNGLVLADRPAVFRGLGAVLKKS